MSRLPQPGSDANVWGDILNDFLTRAHNPDGTLKTLTQAQISGLASDLAAKAADAAVLHLTGNETVGGIKTFVVSPVVPTPTSTTDAANKSYVDTQVSGTVTGKANDNAVVHLTGNETVGGTKTFSASPVVPTPSAGTGAANKTYVDTQVAGKASDTAVLHLTGNETAAGIKTFSVSPVVPTPTSGTDAANKAYTDSQVSSAVGGKANDSAVVHVSGNESVGGVKTFTASPVVPAPSATTDAANKSYVDTQLSTKATDSSVLHLTGNETAAGTKTFSGDVVFPEQAARTGQITLYSVNDAGGFVQKNLVFKDMGVLSRGGPVWVDSSGRVQAWLGWHDQIPSGSSHHGVEVKTAGDPAGPNSTVLVTRFRLKSDADQTQAAFYSCEMVYIENGIYSPDTQFGLTFNTPQSGSVAAGTSSGKYGLGKLTYNVDSTGGATFDLGVGLDNTTAAHVRVFRDSNVTTANFAIYAADGTSTQTFFIDAKTGATSQTGRQQFKTSAGVITLNLNPTVDVNGHTIIDNDVVTSDTTHNATFRLFRNTNTTQTRSFRILKGDGTNTDSFVVNAGTGDVTVTGALNVTGNITANNLFDEFELRRSSNVSSMNRMLASSNITLTSGTVYGVLAFAKAAGSFTKIRFATGSGTFPTLTDFRLGVYNSANVLLAQTANLTGTVSAASTLYDNLALDTTVTTTVGQQLYLAIAYSGTGSFFAKGINPVAAMAGLSPALAKTTTYAGGSMPGLGSSATGNIPWIELVP